LKYSSTQGETFKERKKLHLSVTLYIAQKIGRIVHGEGEGGKTHQRRKYNFGNTGNKRKNKKKKNFDIIITSQRSQSLVRGTPSKKVKFGGGGKGKNGTGNFDQVIVKFRGT